MLTSVAEALKLYRLHQPDPAPNIARDLLDMEQNEKLIDDTEE